MGFIQLPLPPGIVLAGWIGAGWALLTALRAVSWPRLAASGAQHVWLGATLGVFLLWTLRAGVRPDLDLHLLGAPLLALMFGRPLALVSLAIVVGAFTAQVGGRWENLGVNLLLLAALPATLATSLLALVERRLPRNIFVYIFANGFFGAALTGAATAVAAALAHAAAGTYDWDYVRAEFLPFALLLAWGEAFLTGLAIAVFVVYRPEWVATFDDARYLARRGPP